MAKAMLNGKFIAMSTYVIMIIIKPERYQTNN
jgi:hypothetical protein